MNSTDSTATVDATPGTLAALNRQFTQALLALAEAGQADAACRAPPGRIRLVDPAPPTLTRSRTP